MPFDPDLDKALETLDLANRRMNARLPLIDEALVELESVEYVSLAGYMGFGRTLLVTDAVRAALVESAALEREELQKEVDEARKAVMNRRSALAGVDERGR